MLLILISHKPFVLCVFFYLLSFFMKSDSFKYGGFNLKGTFSMSNINFKELAKDVLITKPND